GIIGTGTMGHGIAQVASCSGFEVLVKDISDERTKKGVSMIEKNWGRLVEKGKIPVEQAEKAKQQITLCATLEELKDCDLIIEAVTENVQVKKELFAQLNGIIKKEAIFATNTSSISITLLAAASGRPTQFVGMHFFNPVPLMALVEIIRGIQTSDEAYQAVLE